MRWRIARFPVALHECQHTSCLILAIYTFHHTCCVTSLRGLSLTSSWLDYHCAQSKTFACREYEGIMIVLVNQAFLYLNLGLWCCRCG
ncbi:hypothetical protein EDC04DRAFT_2631415 [Pisolithus marmoratus]|nr:hypothetical protein EDC04DRAFT_2631415 [Pisolithus marmoratus]